MQLAVIATLMQLVAGPSLDSGWNLAPCDATHAADWAKRAILIRRAAPDSPHYLPKPFPRAVADVIEDYRHQLARWWPTENEVPHDMREVYAGSDGGQFVVEVVKVQNWGYKRCSPDAERPFDYLLRLLRRADGVEVGRVTLTDEGYISATAAAPPTQMSPPAGRRERLPDLDWVLGNVRTNHGIVGRDAQYVAIDGLPLRCQALRPCVAFRAKGDSYVVSPGLGVFHLPASARRVDAELASHDRVTAAEALALDESETIVSLGGKKAYAIARRIGELKDRP